MIPEQKMRMPGTISSSHTPRPAAQLLSSLLELDAFNAPKRRISSSECNTRSGTLATHHGTDGLLQRRDIPNRVPGEGHRGCERLRRRRAKGGKTSPGKRLSALEDDQANNETRASKESISLGAVRRSKGRTPPKPWLPPCDIQYLHGCVDGVGLPLPVVQNIPRPGHEEQV